MIANGMVHSLTENVRNLPARITDSGASGLPLDQGYAWDEDGNPILIADYTAQAFTRHMTYDGLDRLDGASANALPGNHGIV